MEQTVITVPKLIETTFDGGHIRRVIRSRGAERVTWMPAESGSEDPESSWWKGYMSGRRPISESKPSESVQTVELFCGPGGLALGFSQALAELGLSHTSLAAVDEDDGAIAVYRANHATLSALAESVSMIVDYQIRGARDTAEFVYEPEMVGGEWEGLVGQVDTVLAGPPCQGHSNLNNRSRRSDPRNELYLTVPAIAIALKARAIVIENVPSVVHDRLGVVESTKKLLADAGYKLSSGVLHADRMGWPQQRARYFLVARLDEDPIPLDEVASQLKAPPRDIMWAIGDLVDAPSNHFLTACAELSDENKSRIEYLFETDTYDLDLSQRPECHRDGTTYKSVYGRLHPDRPSPTITTGFMTPGRGRYVHPLRKRTINAWEAARIQGFPDSYVFSPDPERPPTRAQLSKWIGDAVPMPLGYAAGLSVLA